MLIDSIFCNMLIHILGSCFTLFIQSNIAVALNELCHFRPFIFNATIQLKRKALSFDFYPFQSIYHVFSLWPSLRLVKQLQTCPGHIKETEVYETKYDIHECRLAGMWIRWGIFYHDKWGLWFMVTNCNEYRLKACAI